MYIVYINNTFHLYIHNTLNIQTMYCEYKIREEVLWLTNTPF